MRKLMRRLRWRELVWVGTVLLGAVACGDDDETGARPDLRQLDLGLPGTWVRNGACPLESVDFCPLYGEILEIDAQLFRGTRFLGAQNAPLATATYRIVGSDVLEVRDVATDETRTLRTAVDATNLRLCDSASSASCLEFRRLANPPPKPTGNHPLPPIARVVYEFAIDGSSTTVEASGSAGQAIFPPAYGLVLPHLHSQSLVEPTPGNLHYANIESALVGPDPERVEDYRFRVEIFRTARDANVSLGKTAGLVVLVPGTTLEIPGSDGDHAYRFRVTIR